MLILYLYSWGVFISKNINGEDRTGIFFSRSMSYCETLFTILDFKM